MILAYFTKYGGIWTRLKIILKIGKYKLFDKSIKERLKEI